MVVLIMATLDKIYILTHTKASIGDSYEAGVNFFWSFNWDFRYLFITQSMIVFSELAYNQNFPYLEKLYLESTALTMIGLCGLSFIFLLPHFKTKSKAFFEK